MIDGIRLSQCGKAIKKMFRKQTLSHFLGLRTDEVDFQLPSTAWRHLLCGKSSAKDVERQTRGCFVSLDELTLGEATTSVRTIATDSSFQASFAQIKPLCALRSRERDAIFMARRTTGCPSVGGIRGPQTLAA